MRAKCSYFDVTLLTVTSVVLWLDVIICSCVVFVEFAEAYAFHIEHPEAYNDLFRVVECFFVNVLVGLIAIHGVRHNKPKFLIPYIVCKCIFAGLIVFLITFWSHRISITDSSKIIIGCLLFVLQLYAAFICIWYCKRTAEALRACSKKTFKSVVSIWIGDTSNMLSASDSACIIETER